MASPATAPVTSPHGPPAPPPEELAFARALVELFGDAATVLGIPWSIAAIYAVIFASPRPLSFADIEERLQISKGSVSQGLRVLREFGAVQIVNDGGQKANGGGRRAEGGRQWTVGERRTTDNLTGGPSLSPSLSPAAAARRDHYAPNLELRQLAGRLLKERIEPQLAGGSKRLTALVDSVPFADPAAADLVRGRLKHLQIWQRKARKLVPFAKTLLTLG